MWLSKTKYDALVARIEALEKKDYAPSMLLDARGRSSGDSSIWWFYESRYRRVGMDEVIRAILKHLNLALKKTDDKPGEVVVEAKEEFTHIVNMAPKKAKK